MTDGTRILRTVAVPVIVALIFLFLVPKTCQKAIGNRKLRRPDAAATPPGDSALHIQSDAPGAPPSKPVIYPAGLTAHRIQYLVEIDPKFSEPEILRVPKNGGLTIGDVTAADKLVSAGFLEHDGSGYRLATGATLHLEGVTEETRTSCSSGWSLSIDTLPAARFARSIFISPLKAAFCGGVTSLVNMPSISSCIVPKMAAKIVPPLPLPAMVPMPKRITMASSDAAPHPIGTHRGKSGRTSDGGAV